MLYNIAVAPFAGAWIEIETCHSNATAYVVAPFAGAWIEIINCRLNHLTVSRRSLRGSVDWNNKLPFNPSVGVSRSLRGSVDWNQKTCNKRAIICGRSLRGSVDWNEFNDVSFVWFSVAPFAGAWIEIAMKELKDLVNTVAPFAGAWIEIYPFEEVACMSDCRSLRGSVDWNGLFMLLKSQEKLSLPSRERGLKSSLSAMPPPPPPRRSLRGSVDWNKRYPTFNNY